MAEDQGYRGPFAPTSPAPKQGFAHNEESSHSTFTRKLVKILKNARNCTTSFT